ncbi:MAG: M28 family peptidase [Deltaproteobacteria bacterium]|nr:M28 family peptidase [Deltaproteobacteria bacterium]
MDTAARQRFERRVRDLVAFGHRGSATPHEARAAEYLASEARAAGLEPTTVPFTGCSSFGARLFLHVVVAAVGLLPLWTVPFATIALGLFALVSLLAEESSWPALLGRLVVAAQSRNVEARVPAAGGPPRARVVVLGHYDTQRTGLMWREGLIRRLGPMLARSPGPTRAPMFPVVLAMALQIVAGALALAAPSLRPVGIVLAAFAFFVYAVAGFVLAEWARGPFVPGASDNATGSAAVFSLVEEWRKSPPEAVELVALWTGCEETGLMGSAAWAVANRRAVQAVPTTFLNVDTLGRGRPRFVGVEYSIGAWPVRYPPALLELCARAAAEAGFADAGPKPMSVPSDALQLLVRGIPGATVMCFEDDGHLPGCHQMIDTMDNVDFEVAWSGVRLAWEILRRLAPAR